MLAAMPQFVVLEHETPPGEARGRHWDFMLEVGEALRTWALSEVPGEGPPIEAAALGDHRRAYLDYEGPISGDRGTVARWDRGSYEIVDEAAGELTVELRGRRLIGRARLTQNPSSPERWRFEWLGGCS